MPNKVSVSILGADCANLGAAVNRIDKSAADALHLDIMDGTLVSNISFGVPTIRALRSYTKKEFDVHLMLQTPLQFIQGICEAGADVIAVHPEAYGFEEALEDIVKRGKKAALALSPDTGLDAAAPYLHNLARVLILGVPPGFGAQEFIPEIAEKIYDLADMIGSLPVEIAVDGGMNEQTARLARESGAKIICAGSFVTSHPNWEERIDILKNA